MLELGSNILKRLFCLISEYRLKQHVPSTLAYINVPYLNWPLQDLPGFSSESAVANLIDPIHFSENLMHGSYYQTYNQQMSEKM